MLELDFDSLAAELRRGTRCVLQVRHAERPRIDQNDPSFGDGVALTEEGRRTARAFGERLAAFAESARFRASPLLRTRMTAALIAEGMGIPDAPVPTEDLLGNGSFYYDDPSVVLEIFKHDRFFDACFRYFRDGELPGFRNLRAAADDCERWLLERLETPLLVAVTHDCFIAAFLAAKSGIQFSRENWLRFLDGGAILVDPDGSRRYALFRAGLSDGIRGVVQ